MGHTTDDVGLVRLYLEEIGREPLLSREQETRLARAIDRGRRAAEELRRDEEGLTPARRAALTELVATGERCWHQLVRANLRLVVAQAKHWTGSGLPLLDLIQEGNLGLLRAVDRFDHRKGFRFSTYATWWIRQALARAVANTGRLVRLPVHTGEALTRVRREQRRLEEHEGRAPSLQAVAASSGLPVQEVSRLLQLAPEPLSLSGSVGDDGQELGAVVSDATASSPADAALAALLPGEIHRLMAGLDSLDREVIALRFGLGGDDPWSVEAIATALGLSPNAVRQSQARALRNLRRAVRASPGTRELLAI